MSKFLARFGSAISAVLSGWDRLVIRGNLIPLIRPLGMESLLRRIGVKQFGYGDYVRSTSEKIKKEAEQTTDALGRPRRYLACSGIDKEALVRKILVDAPVNEGLVCTLTTVEPCMTFEYHRSQNLNERGLKYRERKCLHIYRYFQHPELGLIGTRLQTWFPFGVQIWMNGRESLAVALKRNGIEFRRHDNCFTWLKEPEAAQHLMDQQLQTNWLQTLTSMVASIHPLRESIFEAWPQEYYWSTHQSEYATDYLFKEPAELNELFPLFCGHAIRSFSSDDVMRFLAERKVPVNYLGQVVSSYKRRREGVRVKHTAASNSVKMYDKADNVLRIETTINNPKPFRSFRTASNDPDGQPAWKPMRKSIADSYRRAEIGKAVNDRYATALAHVVDSEPLKVIFDQVSKPILGQTRTRAIRIGDPDDLALLQAVSRGEFVIHGFRNRDLRHILFPAASPQNSQIISARITRLLRILREHRLISKISGTHRYRLTDKGRKLATAIFTTRQVTTQQLATLAA
jgi:hypothetical protein